MKSTKELTELRGKEAKTLLSELTREREQLARERIAVKLGKQSKVHELSARRARIARILTILSESLTGAREEKVEKK